MSYVEQRRLLECVAVNRPQPLAPSLGAVVVSARIWYTN